jgi:diguanylate cyclase (GGDEF)-like protein/PAS domain S-box-containing protein
MPACANDLARVLEMLPDPVVVVHQNGNIQWANHAAVQFSGIEASDLTGLSVFELLHPDDHALAAAAFTSVTKKEVGRLIDVRINDAKNRWRHCEIRGRSVDAEDGDGPSIVIGIRDTADRQGLEFGSGDTNLLRALVHHATSLLIGLDEDGCITSANAELTRLLGYDLGVVAGEDLSAFVHVSDQSAFRDALASINGSFSAPYTFRHAEGYEVVLDLNITDLRTDPLINGFVVSATNISDLKRTQQQLRDMADHDALTGVLNRRAFLTQLDELARKSSEHEIMVLFCDLDGFKPVNDQFGHAAGDEALVEVAQRIERVIRPDDLVARLGGDEFVVALPHSGPILAKTIATRIREAIIEPIIVTGRAITIDVSIGISVTTGQPTTAQLLATADEAMYAVKNHRDNTETAQI